MAGTEYFGPTTQPRDDGRMEKPESRTGAGNGTTTRTGTGIGIGTGT